MKSKWNLFSMSSQPKVKVKVGRICKHVIFIVTKLTFCTSFVEIIVSINNNPMFSYHLTLTLNRGTVTNYSHENISQLRGAILVLVFVYKYQRVTSPNIFYARSKAANKQIKFCILIYQLIQNL